MVPVARDADKFKQYKDGKYYDLEEARERSIQSHNLYFKAVGITWLNLPERDRDLYATDDHWREFCLIKAGFRKERVAVMPSPEAAQACALGADWSATIRKNFVVTYVEGNIVHILVARTQKMIKNDPDGMDKKDFEASKQAVLEICAAVWPGLMTVDQLLEEAKRQMS